MSLFKNVTLPQTPEARAVRKYLEAQNKGDFSNSSEFFSEDVIFNDLLFKCKGREFLTRAFTEFLVHVRSLRIEAIAELGSSERYMILYWIVFKGEPACEDLVLCDLVTTKEGKIARVDNVFDVDKVPKSVRTLFERHMDALDASTPALE